MLPSFEGRHSPKDPAITAVVASSGCCHRPAGAAYSDGSLRRESSDVWGKLANSWFPSEEFAAGLRTVLLTVPAGGELMETFVTVMRRSEKSPLPETITEPFTIPL